MIESLNIIKSFENVYNKNGINYINASENNLYITLDNSILLFIFIPFIPKNYKVYILFQATKFRQMYSIYDRILGYRTNYILNKGLNINNINIRNNDYTILENKDNINILLSHISDKYLIFKIKNFKIDNDSIIIPDNQQNHNINYSNIGTDNFLNYYKNYLRNIENVFLFIKFSPDRIFRRSFINNDILNKNSINSRILENTYPDLTNLIPDSTKLLYLNRDFAILNIDINYMTQNKISAKFNYNDNTVYIYDVNNPIDLTNLYDFTDIYITLYNDISGKFRLVKADIYNDRIIIKNKGNINLSSYNTIFFPLFLGYVKPLVYNFNIKNPDNDPFEKILVFMKYYIGIT